MSKDIPIIFSAPMVRALLDGRKTMTRRVLKPQPEPFLIDGRVYCDVDVLHGEGGLRPRVTLGRVITKQQLRYAMDDRLWVRETVACGACAPSKPSTWSASFWRREQGSPANPNGLWYAADGLAPHSPITSRGRWVPSIHMPRWASRLTLVVTGIKVERLQDIGEADAIAEGIPTHVAEHTFRKVYRDKNKRADARIAYFRDLWENLNGPASWNVNPFVVAISFRTIKANIDAPAARHAA